MQRRRRRNVDVVIALVARGEYDWTLRLKRLRVKLLLLLLLQWILLLLVQLYMRGAVHAAADTALVATAGTIRIRIVIVIVRVPARRVKRVQSAGRSRRGLFQRTGFARMRARCRISVRTARITAANVAIFIAAEKEVGRGLAVQVQTGADAAAAANCTAVGR